MIIKGYILLLAGCLVLFAQCTSKEDAKNFRFRYMDTDWTGVGFSNQIDPFDSVNIIQYLYAFNGGGVAAGDINNDGLPDLYFASNQGENKLYLNKGDFKFEDITYTAGVGGSGDWSTGVSMVDMNADGLLDIYVCQVGGYKKFKGRNLLYINNGDLSFSERAAEFGLNHRGLSTQAAYLDYDRDGDLDIYLLCHSVHAPGNYNEASIRQKIDPISGDRLFRNEKGHFVDVTLEAGIYSSKIGYGLGVGVSDFNEDGYPDIYVGNDFHENDYMYLNNRDGSFREVVKESMDCNSKFTMGLDISDINNDGKMDIFALDMKPESEYILKKSEAPENKNIYDMKLKLGYHHQFSRNVLQVQSSFSANEDKLHFVEMAQYSGLDATDWSWSALMTDYDCDGLNDIYISNGILFRPNDMDFLNFISNEAIQANEPDSVLIQNMPDGKMHNYIFKNLGDLSFQNVSSKWIESKESYSNGTTYADFDNDGDIDLVVNNINDSAYILKNQTLEMDSVNFLKILLRGTDMNPYAIGSKLILHSEGTIQFREMYPVRGFMSSVDYTIHFGLGKFSHIDSLVVMWPDGSTQVERALISNQMNTISYQPTVIMVVEKDSSQGCFLDVTDQIDLNYEHKENKYNDLEREPLMPYLLSKDGPALAVGDVNSDGLDDLYLGGAYGQSGGIFFQNPDGTFTRNQEDFWGDILKFEDVDAAFLDIDKDEDLDLFVASGGNHLPPGSPYYADRLYKNDGVGNFKLHPGFFESQVANSSCVATGDINGDGNIDIFVGVNSIPGNYGLLPTSKIWINDGNGNLLKTSLQDPIQGMVTDAKIRDLNDDGFNELIVVGHWMPVTLYWNSKNGITKEELSGTRGLWNAIEVNDLDNDGRMDLVAGNLGLNTHLKASNSVPIKMYTNDFNNDGDIESVITYVKQGKEYPIFHKDQLLKQLIDIKKDFVRYEKFAESSIHEIFNPEKLEASQELSLVELRSVIFYGMKNEYVKVPLPSEAQNAPINAFCLIDVSGDGLNDIIGVGNSNSFVPMIGRMKANTGVVGINKGDRNFKCLKNNEKGFLINEVCTDLLPYKNPYGSTSFILAINDGKPRILELLD